MLDLKHLPNQQADEKVVLFIRPFWFEPLTILMAMVLLYGALLGVWFWFSDSLALWLADPLIGPIVVVFAGMYVGAVWLFAFLQFTSYYLDTWIITTERIISVDQDGLFSRTSSELHLASVQDVTSEVRGILHTFFNYGDMYVQTAGEKERFIFKNIPHPEKTREIVVDLVDLDKRRHGSPEQTREKV